MQIVSANLGTKAHVLRQGEAKAILADVVAWGIDEGRGMAPMPIVACAAPGCARVAVRINEAGMLFEWPSTWHANAEAFVKYVA
jgi:hypothetical protein